LSRGSVTGISCTRAFFNVNFVQIEACQPETTTARLDGSGLDGSGRVARKGPLTGTCVKPEVLLQLNGLCDAQPKMHAIVTLRKNH
jgi:hypothetical protein